MPSFLSSITYRDGFMCNKYIAQDFLKITAYDTVVMVKNYAIVIFIQ